MLRQAAVHPLQHAAACTDHPGLLTTPALHYSLRLLLQHHARRCSGSAAISAACADAVKVRQCMALLWLLCSTCSACKGRLHLGDILQNLMPDNSASGTRKTLAWIGVPLSFVFRGTHLTSALLCSQRQGERKIHQTPPGSAASKEFWVLSDAMPRTCSHLDCGSHIWSRQTSCLRPQVTVMHANDNPQVAQLAHEFRTRGHLVAQLDPLRRLPSGAGPWQGESSGDGGSSGGGGGSYGAWAGQHGSDTGAASAAHRQPW